MTDTARINRPRSVGSNVLVFLPGVAVAAASIVKFAHVPAVVQQMAAMGFTEGRLTLVATLEIVSALLFLFPRTRSLGLLLLSAFLGGAICAHVQTGEVSRAAGPAVLLLLAWIGTWLRHPEMLWSLRSPQTERGS